jgi:hypothetical protein
MVSLEIYFTVPVSNMKIPGFSNLNVYITINRIWGKQENHFILDTENLYTMHAIKNSREFSENITCILNNIHQHEETG